MRDRDLGDKTEFMSTTLHHKEPRLTRFVALASAVSLGMTMFLLAGCSTPPPEDPASSSEQGLRSVDGRGVSASETELVLRTADGDQAFQIREQDVQAVDPAHFSSHIGIESLGFRVYFVSEGNATYAVSVEEIDGATLGFD